MLLTTTWFGTFLIDPESGIIKKKKLFPKSVPKLVQRLNAIQNQEILSEEQNLIKNLKLKANESLSVTDHRLECVSELVSSIEPLPENITLEPTAFGFEPELYQQAILELGKQRTRDAVGKDHYIIQAELSITDLTEKELYRYFIQKETCIWKIFRIR